MVPALEVGPLTVHAFGVLAALCIAVGVHVAGRRARAIGLGAEIVHRAAPMLVAATLVGAHLFSVVFYFPDRLVEDPLLLLRVWDGISSFGGAVGLAAAAWMFCRRRGVSFPAFAHCLLYAFPFLWVVGRLGCTLAFDHPGALTDSWLGMPYPGGPDLSAGARHNLAVYEVAWAAVVATAFLLRRAPPRAEPWHGLVIVVTYLPVRFALDFLRAADALYLGLTPAQWLIVGGLATTTLVLQPWTPWRGRLGPRNRTGPRPSRP